MKGGWNMPYVKVPILMPKILKDGEVISVQSGYGFVYRPYVEPVKVMIGKKKFRSIGDAVRELK